MTVVLAATDLDTLVQVATRSVREAVLERREWRPEPGDHTAALREPGAAFVTLRDGGRLRGCIGTLEARAPLVVCVADRARAAALHDPRFEPVTADELAHLDVEVSVLTPNVPLDVHGYDELLRTVRPGVDGLTVEAGWRGATLLPSVWDELPSAQAFVGALWRKAGLAPGEWPHGIRVSIYGAQHAP